MVRAAVALAVVGAGAFADWTLFVRLHPSAEMAPFVHARPTVPVVFTSRSSTASLDPSAREAEGFQYPGTLPWAAAEGRLRRLDPDGSVYELTWGRELPDGSTLMDVMSPSVSLDGTRILFAGRKGPPDPGHFRIYEIGVDGRGLRQVTGGPDDPGCDAAPPMRFAEDGTVLPIGERKRIDYDDIDPADRGDGGIVFASSRGPDLGRGHSRRATQIWQLRAGEVVPKPLTANRNNDRWPVLVRDDFVLFSLWSRNREAVTADEKAVRPWTSDGSFATRPTDFWMAARVHPDGSQFGYVVKVPEPVWRPRPLFNGQVCFMTAGPGPLRLAQAPVGLLRLAESSLAEETELPTQAGPGLIYGPDHDLTGRPLSAATPSPMPDHRVLFAAAPLLSAGPPEPAGYGLYQVSEDWSGPAVPELLFDDPRLVDAEPVAVYARDLPIQPPGPPRAIGHSPDRLALLTGGVSEGPFGFVENLNVDTSVVADDMPGQETDTGAKPVFPPFTNVRRIAVYAARRDRFDDPTVPRIAGKFEPVIEAPLDTRNGASLRMWLPTDSPSVLAGLDANGKVARIESPATDAKGRRAAFYAVAGDHYSGTRPGGYHFCVGCHTGHTYIPIDLGERVK